MISIVTPWSGDTASLLPDYANATHGAQVVIVDNGTPEETQQHLVGVTEVAGNVYIRNEQNAGFAAGNNQGYARAEGDIIIFLNSDVAGDPAWLALVADDVKDGALYGPSLQSQLVAGRWLPYLEGWCIAATRATWERLTDALCNNAFKASLPSDITENELMRVRQELKETFGDGRRVVVMPNDAKVDFVQLSTPGPWDAYSYPGPYWEDNDLCFRAVQAGISLVQTAWPIQHKGGRTAGPILNHALSFAANERTFTERVLAAHIVTPPTPTYATYLRHAQTQSDIQHHLPLLYSLARGNVVELGTRGGVSTAALLAGVEAHGGRVWSIDIEDCSQVAAGHPLWTFNQGDSRDPNWTWPASFTKESDEVYIDLLLIDTQHEYEVTRAELALWGNYMAPGGAILLHDTETFPGVLRAVREYCAAHGHSYTNVRPCNGMAVIDVPATKDMPTGETVSTEGASWAMETVK